MPVVVHRIYRPAPAVMTGSQVRTHRRARIGFSVRSPLGHPNRGIFSQTRHPLEHAGGPSARPGRPHPAARHGSPHGAAVAAGPVAPVIPQVPVRPAVGTPGRVACPLPLAGSPPGSPAVAGHVVYGIGRIDASGRVADRVVTGVLGWHCGDRLASGRPEAWFMAVTSRWMLRSSRRVAVSRRSTGMPAVMLGAAASPAVCGDDLSKSRSFHRTDG